MGTAATVGTAAAAKALPTWLAGTAATVGSAAAAATRATTTRTKKEDMARAEKKRRNKVAALTRKHTADAEKKGSCACGL